MTSSQAFYRSACSRVVARESNSRCSLPRSRTSVLGVPFVVEADPFPVHSVRVVILLEGHVPGSLQAARRSVAAVVTAEDVACVIGAYVADPSGRP